MLYIMVGRLKPGRPLPAGGFRWRTQRDSLDEGADLVVATPGRLAEHVKAGNLKLAQCRALVLDEADVLLGDAFAFAEQVWFFACLGLSCARAGLPVLASDPAGAVPGARDMQVVA